MTGTRGAAERRGRRVALAILLTALAVQGAAAQTLDQRVAAVRDGEVLLSFAARAGVCGNGRSISTQRADTRWEPWCEPGPVRVALAVRAGRVVDVDTYVGGRWRSGPQPVGATDLGVVPAGDAARFFLDVAERAPGRAGRDAVFAASLADSVMIWPELVRLAGTERLPRETRKAAVFWLAQAAGEAAVGDLEDLVDNPDREIQEAAVFGLSQMRNDQALTALMEIARTHRDPQVRKKAMFWLGQSHDPRVIALFEEILVRN